MDKVRVMRRSQASFDIVIQSRSRRSGLESTALVHSKGIVGEVALWNWLEKRMEHQKRYTHKRYHQQSSYSAVAPREGHVRVEDDGFFVHEC